MNTQNKPIFFSFSESENSDFVLCDRCQEDSDRCSSECSTSSRWEDTTREDCDHSSFGVPSALAVCDCCNACYNISQAFVRCKGSLTRNRLKFLGFQEFEGFVTELNHFISKYAEGSTYNRTSCKHAVTFPGLLGDGVEVTCDSPCRTICDNVEHLFECSSACNQARGELFPIYREGHCWYASCKNCNASCQFTPTAAMTPILMLLRHVKVKREEDIFLCGPRFGAWESRISEITYLYMRAFLTGGNVENWLDVGFQRDLGQAFGDIDDIGFEGSFRYATPVLPPIDEEDCEHEFVLWNSRGFELPLGNELLQVFMQYLTGSGYFRDTTLGEKCGIASVCGLRGVHVRCSAAFVDLHRYYHNGPFRQSLKRFEEDPIAECREMGVRLARVIVKLEGVQIGGSSSVEDLVSATAQMESSSETEAERKPRLYEETLFSDDEKFECESHVEMVSLDVDEFLRDDSPLFEEQEVVRIATRGLKQRIGGLLKGISNCVVKLHKVWDWPLDKAVKVMNDTGNFLEEHKDSISEDVWSCQMCKTLQEDMKQGFKDHTEILEVLRKTLERVSGALDQADKMRNANESKLEEDIKSVKLSLKELEGRQRQMANSTSTANNLQAQVDQHDIIVKKLAEKVDRLRAKTDQGASTPPRRESFKVDSSIPGEQMEVPRTLPQPIKKYVSAKKQGETVETAIAPDEEDKFFSIQDAVVETRGSDAVHNAVRAKHLVASFDWSVSSGEGSTLADISMPDAVMDKNERLENFMSYFQYYTCSAMEFEISVTSIGMQGGTLMVVWDSLGVASRQKISSMLQLSGLPHVYVHAASSSVTTFVVNCSSIQHQMCLSGSEGSYGVLGTLKLVCCNVLNVPAETSQSVRVNVWAKFIGLDLGFYTRKHEVVMGQGGEAGVYDTNLGTLEAIVARGKWSTVSSTNLFELVMHPCSCAVEQGLVYQTPLSVVSNIYARWSGSLIVKLVVGASMFVKGRLMMTAIPVQFRQSSLTLGQMSAFPCEVFSLSGQKREFEFEVPYHSIGKNSLVSRDAIFDVSSYSAEMVTTRIHCVILDPLVMNANASNSVSYVVTLRPGLSFKLMYPQGVKCEFVNRVVSQNFQESFTCAGLIGQGFSTLCGRFSVMSKVAFDGEKMNALWVQVAPVLRMQSPGTTLLSWLSQVFVQWRGSLRYKLRAHGFDKNKSAYFRIWHDVNGSTRTGEEMQYTTDVDPPAGVDIVVWRPADGDTIVEVPFCARTEKLILPKVLISGDSFDWVRNYNGTLVMDYEGSGKVSVEISIAGGDDFEMFDKSVVPKCGKVSEAFTKLSYAGKLLDATAKPVFDRERLKGPSTQAIVSGVPFRPVKGVGKAAGAARELERRPPSTVSEREPMDFDEFSSDSDMEIIEGDTRKVGKDRYIRVGGQWVLITADAQMLKSCVPGCFGFNVNSLNKHAELLEKNETCSKVVDLVDNLHGVMNKTLEAGFEEKVPMFMETMNTLSKLIGKFDKASRGFEEKIGIFESVRLKLMAMLSPLIVSSIPGLVRASVDKEQYVWATIVTLLGIIMVAWTCTSVKKLRRKVSILCMIIWSPFLVGKAWELGSWIAKKFCDFGVVGLAETCRKHSDVGVAESQSVMETVFSWIGDNWSKYAQSILSLFGVITSLVVWGAIPDGKKLTNFAAKFKEAGDRGRTFTGLTGGLKAIVSMSQDMSKWIVDWILSAVSKKEISADSKLQQLVDFNIKEWVKEVRDFALIENKWTDFGAQEHLEKVRRLYDKNVEIQEKLLEGCKVDLQLSLILKECREKCVEFRNDSYTFKGMKKPRIDPIHICLIGKPGVGKSALTHVLINDLLDARNEPVVDRIYTRCCADAYWSNYHQEPVILYDDLGAIKSNLRLSDYAEIMGIKTNDPFSVPMAIAEEKGRHCTSKYVFSCTNVKQLDDTGDVVTKPAYYRRRNIFVEVSRDENVVRMEEDPTHALRFTVFGYAVSGGEQAHVEFGVKETWDESFLRDVDTEGWRFENVDYAVFLKFVLEYTNAYMASQERLVATLSRTRSGNHGGTVAHGAASGTGSDESEAEVEMVGRERRIEVTLKQLMDKFDEKKVIGKDLYNKFKDIKQEHKCGKLNTRKVVTMRDFMSSFCCCYRGKGDPCSYWMSDFNDIQVKLAQRGAAMDMRRFGQVRLARKSLDTVLSLREGYSLDNCFDGLADVQVALRLQSYFHWDPIFCSRQVCPSRVMITTAEQCQQLLTADEVDEDDMLGDELSFEKRDGHYVLVWPGVTTFYPEHVAEFGCVGVQDDERMICMVPHKSETSLAKTMESWISFMTKQRKLEYAKILLLPKEDRGIVKAAMNEITSFSHSEVSYSPNLRKQIGDLKRALGTEKEKMVFLLMVQERVADHFSYVASVRKELEKGSRMDQVMENYTKYERLVCNDLSRSVRIGLAIAGGFVAVGTLVSIGLMVRKVLRTLGGFFGKDDKELSSDSPVEIEDLVVEDVEAENLTGANESAAEKTRFTARQRLVPRGRWNARVKKLQPQMMGAHESSAEKTKFSVTQRQLPRKRNVVGSKVAAQITRDGFGTLYDYQTAKVPKERVEVITKSKKKRTKVVSVRKQMVSASKQFGTPTKLEKVRSDAAIMEAILKWQKNVTGEGVLGPLESRNVNEVSKVVRAVMKSLDDGSAETSPVGKILEDDWEIKYGPKDADLVEALNANKLSRTSVKAMLTSGVNVTALKQMRIGAVGFEKDLSASKLIETHVLKMSCVIFDNTIGVQSHVLRLRGTVVLCPAHYMSEFKEEHELYFVCPSKVVRVYAKRERMALVSQFQDLIVWDLGNQVPPSTDYTKHIANVEDWKNFRNGEGSMCQTKYNPKMLVQAVHLLGNIERVKANVEIPTGIYPTYDSTHTIVGGLRYRAGCAPGFCGSAIVRSDTKLVRKIVGMHVAGNQDRGVGYAEMLIQELIVGACDSLDNDRSKLLDGENLDNNLIPCAVKQCDLPGLGNLGVIGKVSSELVPRAPARTTIQKSLIHGLLGPVKTEPSILGTWDKRLGEKRGKWDPVYDAVTKYGVSTVPFEVDEITLVEEHLCGVFEQMENSLGKREVNGVEVGINGIDQSDFWQPMNLKTSPGFPYILRRPPGAVGKVWMFELDGQYPSSRPRYKMADKEFVENYERALGDIKVGRPPKLVTIECPKDERRKLSKIYGTPATRTFTILPPEINILFRQYFGDFAAMVMVNRHNSFCQVGIDAGTSEWSDLMNSFKKIGSRGFAGDYAKFDGIGPAPIYHSIVNVVNAWYKDGEENARARHALLSCIVHRNGLAGEWLLRYSQGMPSGFAMTVIFNSFVNYYFMAMAWMNLVENSELSHQANLRDFDYYTRVITYGDDNVVAVDDHFLEIYNLRQVASYLADHGVTYTDDQKNPIHLSEPHVDIESVTFLKREFVPVGASTYLWKAPLDKTSVEEQCSWIRDCEVPVDAMNQNVENALYEASVHGEEYFDDLRDRLDEAYAKVALDCPVVTFQECNMRWWSSMSGAVLKQTDLRKLVKLAGENSINLDMKVLDTVTETKRPLKELIAESKYAPLVYLEV